MTRLGAICACALLVLVNSFTVNAAPNREKRSPHFGLAGVAAGAILGVPAAAFAVPAVVLGQANYGPGYGGGYGGPAGLGSGYGGPGYGGPAGLGSGYGGPGYSGPGYGGPSYGGPGYGGPVYGGPGYDGGLPGVSFSSSKSFSIGGGNAQSSASSGGYGK